MYTLAPDIKKIESKKETISFLVADCCELNTVIDILCLFVCLFLGQLTLFFFVSHYSLFNKVCYLVISGRFLPL